MKQVYVQTANYSVDLFGVCSALYELGGLIVMHDASGCNSTYATHDEPRWYDMDSMIYISGLTEYDAVLGNDEKFIADILEIAEERKPKFIAVFGSPVALVMGTDFRGIAHIIENKTGIPTFHFNTNGMESYIEGAGDAMAAIADRFCMEPMRSLSQQITINIMGMTPLDFGTNGNLEAIRDWCLQNGFGIKSCWAMGSGLEELANAGQADVSLVISETGLKAAEILKERFDVPIVKGIPIGEAASKELAEFVRESAMDYLDRSLWIGNVDNPLEEGKITTIIGETVFANSLRFHLEKDHGMNNVRVLCPLEKDPKALKNSDIIAFEEEDIAKVINKSRTVIADPVFESLITEKNINFVQFPHEGYSGRTYQEGIPIFASSKFSLTID